jgi:hypothetical protein
MSTDMATENCVGVHSHVMAVSSADARQIGTNGADVAAETSGLQEQQSATMKTPRFQIEHENGNRLEYTSAAELKEGILAGNVARTLRARMVRQNTTNDERSEEWKTVEILALSNKDLRGLYRPVWAYSLKYIAWGAVAGCILKALDTTILFFTMDPQIGLYWLLVLGSLFVAGRWGWAPIIVAFLSFKFGIRGNLFMAALGVMAVGCILGIPLGLIVGTLLGHCRKARAVLAPDAASEGYRPYVLGLVLPSLFLLIAVPLYVWLSVNAAAWVVR